MRKVLFFAVVAAVLALPAAAAADSFLNGALIKRNGVPCSSCQLIITMPGTVGTFIGNAGSTRTYYNNEAWDVPRQAMIFTETLNVELWSVSGGNPYACHGGDYGSPYCPATVWARSGCPSGYQYAPSKSGYEYSSYPDFWQTFTINTTGCYPP